MNTTGVSNMSLPESQKSESSHDKTDLLLRASRRALFVVLLMVVAFGATVLGRAIWPESVLATWPARMPWLLPVLVVMSLIGGRMFRKGRIWDPHGPEMKKIQQDEFRRMNLSRAQRAALIVVLVLQIPLGLLFVHLPAMRAVMAMGVATITLAIVTLIALFLFFDRD
jgi:hypothetical protein